MQIAKKTHIFSTFAIESKTCFPEKRGNNMRGILFAILLLLTAAATKADNLQSERLRNMIGLSLKEVIEKGDYYYKNNVMDSALFYYMLAFQKNDAEMSEQDKMLCAKALYQSGVIYFRQPNYTKAIDVLFQGVRFCEQNNIKSILPEMYNFIGNIFVIFNDHRSSIIYFEKALQDERFTENPESRFNLLSNLIGAYCSLGDTETARRYYEEISKISLKNNDYKVFYTMQAEAFIYKTEKNYRKSIETNLKMAEIISRAKKPAINIAFIYSELADIYSQINMEDSALYYFKKTYDISETNKNSELKRASLRGLWKIYEKKGEDRLADHYNYLRLQLLDSLYNYTEFNQVKSMQEIYEMNKVEKEIIQLREIEKEKSRAIANQYKLFAITLIVLAAVIIVCMIFYRQKKKISESYRKLYEKNEELLAVAEENTQIRKKINDNESEAAEEDETEKEAPQKKDRLPEETKEKLINDIMLVVNNPDIICDSQFSQRKLAELINSNTAYISMVINDKYHQNFSSFVNEYRIRLAQKRLADQENYGSYTIKAIAESVGYKSQANFIQAFKAVTGITPSTYQKEARKDK